MSFPASVEQVVLTRRRPGPSKRSSNNGEGEDDEAVAVGIGGLSLDYGRLGGVALEKRKGRWGWIWASSEDQAGKIRSGKEDDTQCFFPPNRLIDLDLGSDDIPPKERIKSSIRYAQDLCNHYERDGLPQAISEILMDDLGTQKCQDTDDYDVYQGPKLGIIRNDRARLARNLLAFPTGEVGHHLNIAPFLPSHGYKHLPRSRMQFVPSVKPIERFPTEILQIVSSPVVSSSRIDREATALVVRLHSTTHLLNIIPDPSYIPKLSNSPVISIKSASLSSQDTESRRHVDVAIDPNTWSRILVVDDRGGVWLWWEEKEFIRDKIHKIMNLRLVRPPSPAEQKKEEDQFYRIAFGTKLGTAILLTSKEVIIIDIDDPSHPCTTLLRLRGHDRYFTALEKTALERGVLLTCLVTTHEVIWIDESKVAPPVLSWKHEIGGKDLEVISFPNNDNQGYIVYSKSRHISMVYHLTKSTSTATFVKSLHSPYTLALPNKTHETMIILSPLSERHHPSLLTLTPEGEISAIPIFLLNGHENQDQVDIESKGRRGLAPIKAYWDDEMVEYVDRQPLRRKVGAGVEQEQEQGQEWKEKAKTKSKEMNLRWTWEEINLPYENGGDFHPITFEGYLREFDAPLDQLMTGSDLARDSAIDAEADTHEGYKRSHLLQPLNYIGSTGLPTIQAMDGISLARHLPVISTLNSDILLPPYLKPQLPNTTQSKTQEIYEKLQATFIQRKHVNSPRDRYNLFQLSMELSLSRHILFSEQLQVDASERIRTAAQIDVDRDIEPDELFARAAGKLRITAKEPDKVEFGLLIPRTTSTMDGEEEGRSADGLERQNQVDGGGEGDAGGLQSLTVRGLMSDWIVGRDPSDFARDWKSWIDTADDNNNNNDNNDIDNNNRVDHQSQPRSQAGTTFQTRSQSQSQRLIKPLPSQSKSHSQSQIDLTQLSQIQSQTQPQPHYQAPTLLTSSTSLPNLLDGQKQRHRQVSSQSQIPSGFGGMHRSSPPLMHDSVLGADMDMGAGGWANTQVEPGKFGGRLSLNNGEKKKKIKKRIGGF